MGMVRVQAVERGHCGDRIREEGEQFDVPEERLKDGSTWFAPVGAVKAKPAVAKPSRPPGAGPMPGERKAA